MLYRYVCVVYVEYICLERRKKRRRILGETKQKLRKKEGKQKCETYYSNHFR